MSEEELSVRHAEHFLSRLDRLNAQEVDLALGLSGPPLHAVGAISHRASAGAAPQGGSRVQLARKAREAPRPQRALLLRERQKVQEVLSPVMLE